MLKRCTCKNLNICLLIKLCMYVCLCVHASAPGSSRALDPLEVESVIGGCEPPDLVLETEPRISARATNTFNY